MILLLILDLWGYLIVTLEREKFLSTIGSKGHRYTLLPLLVIGIYLTPRPNTEEEESTLTYGPKQVNSIESEPKDGDFDSCESNSSVETLEIVPEPR